MKTFDVALSYHKTTLNNGLRIIIVEMPHLHSLEISMYVKVGSRFETTHNNGISHFLEHMLFRGTKNMPDSYQLHKSFESLGGDINALTTSEYTCFWLTSHPHYITEGIGLFSEMFTSPNFADIETEKQIILEEILNEHNEKGENINIDDLSFLLLWPNDGLGFSTLGPNKNVLKFTKEDIQSFFHTYYTASNMVLCIAGHAKHEQILPYADKYFSHIPTGNELQIPTQNFSQGKAQTLFKQNPGSQTNVQICFRGLSYNSPDY